jgi:hypothetical protein
MDLRNPRPDILINKFLLGPRDPSLSVSAPEQTRLLQIPHVSPSEDMVAILLILTIWVALLSVLMPMVTVLTQAHHSVARLLSALLTRTRFPVI